MNVPCARVEFMEIGLQPGTSDAEAVMGAARGSAAADDDDELYVYVYKNYQRGRHSQTRTTPGMFHGMFVY